jgi:hypothetical protein
VHHARTNDRSCLGEVPGPTSIDRECNLRPGFGTVDVIERCRVNDPIRTHVLHGPKDCLAISDVEACMVASVQLVVPKPVLQVVSELTPGAR